MKNIFSGITKRTMKQNKVRTLVTIIGVILSAAMITAVTTFGLSFQSFLVDYTIERDGRWHVLFNGLSKDKAEQLCQDEKVKEAAVCTQLGYAKFPPVMENSPGMPYLYIRSLSEEAVKTIPTKLAEGRMPKNDSEILVPETLLANEDEESRTKIGDVYTLEIGDRSVNGNRITVQSMIGYDEREQEVFTPRQTKQVTVVGVYSEWQDVNMGGDAYDVLTGPVQNEDEALYQDVFITLKDPEQVYEFTDQYTLEEGEGYVYHSSLLRWMGIDDNSNLGTILKGFAVVLIIVIMVGSISLIYNAFSISLRERTAQFGLLSSVGATKKQLRKSLRYEALSVSAIGIPIGILAGTGGIGVTLFFIGKDISNWIYGETCEIPLKISVSSIVIAAVIAFVTVLISVWIPSRRIRKISPMEALRATADIKIRPKEVRTGKWAYRLFGLEGMLAQKNYKRDRKKYRTTVLSLTVSIILFTTAALFQMYLLGTGAFVLKMPKYQISYTMSRENTDEDEKKADKVFAGNSGIGKMEKYLAASINIYTEKEGELYLDAYFLPDETFLDFAKKMGVNGEKYLETDRLAAILVNTVSSYNAKTQRYEKTKILEEEEGKDISIGMGEFEGEEYVFQEQAKILAWDVTDKMPSWAQSNTYSPMFLLPRSMERIFEEKTSIKPLLKYDIKSNDYKTVYRQLEEDLKMAGLAKKGQLSNQAKEYEDDKGIMTAINVLTYGFIILISVIAVANVFNTVSTNLLLRRKEFAMLRSVGMPQKNFRKMMCYECLIYGLRSVFYGVAGTLLISAALYKILLEGVDAPFLMPWKYLAIAVMGTFLVVALTMFYCMRKIKNSNIIDELKMS